LARFRFEQFCYDDERQVLTHNETSSKLDPKVADLLNYFIAHAGQVLSRDQLLDDVWAGSIVSDNTISWSVSQLRKALADDSANPKFIQTIPKKGYSFIALVEDITSFSTANGSEQDQRHGTNRGKFYIALSVAAMYALLILGWGLNKETIKPNYSIGTAKLLTGMDGLEEDGFISEDGVLLAFRHKSSADGSTFQIYLKPLLDPTTFSETLDNGNVSTARLSSRREQNPFALTNDNFDYQQVIWGKDSYQLFALRLTAEKCEIVEFTLPLSRDSILQQRQLSQCDPQGRTRLAFGAKTASLYFTDKRNSDTYSVQQLDLHSAEVRQLTTPDTPGLGDHFIDIDVTQSKLLILRDKHWSETEFLSLELSSQTLSKFFDIPSVYYSAYWGPLGQSIWLNWSNATVLRYDLTTMGSDILLQTGFGWNYNTHPVANNAAVFAVSDANAADFLYWNHNSLTKTVTPYTEYMPTFSPISGKLAFVSNQSGMSQLWLKTQADADAMQLSNLHEMKEFTDLNWAQDDNWLIGVTEGVVGAMDVDKQTYHILYKGEYKAQLPRLSASHDKLLFSAQKDELWHLFVYDVQNQLSRDLGEGYQSQWLTEEKFVFSKKGKSGLWSYDLASEQTSSLLESFPAVEYWQIVDNSIYFTSKSLPWGLYQSPIVEFKPVLLVALAEKTGRQFCVNPLDKSVVLEDWRRQQSDLKLAPLIYQ
jgi:transcriptional activator of cad operon